jgi:uncharacterized protein YlzI (FlbEa/FlbD family)
MWESTTLTTTTQYIRVLGPNKNGYAWINSDKILAITSQQYGSTITLNNGGESKDVLVGETPDEVIDRIRKTMEKDK